jgi:hypothetical protein
LLRVSTTAHALAALLHAAINAFSIKNRQLSDADMDERLAHYQIPTDLPLIVQVSRFDPGRIRRA